MIITFRILSLVQALIQFVVKSSQALIQILADLASLNPILCQYLARLNQSRGSQERSQNASDTQKAIRHFKKCYKQSRWLD